MILSKFTNFVLKSQNVKNGIFEPPMYHPPMSLFNYTFVKKYKIRYTKSFFATVSVLTTCGNQKNPHFNFLDFFKILAKIAENV